MPNCGFALADKFGYAFTAKFVYGSPYPPEHKIVWNPMSHTYPKEIASRIQAHASEGATLRLAFFAKEQDRIANMGLRLAATIASGGKLLLCGNGGSAADCQHLAAEFTNRFVIDRPPLPALALTTDSSAITAIGNDFNFNEVFSKQVRALGNKGDILLGISTSGNSANVVAALETARSQGLYCLGFAGRDGGAMASLCDCLFVVESQHTSIIQEIHITLGHLLCGLTDYYLFENAAALTPHTKGERPLPL